MCQAAEKTSRMCYLKTLSDDFKRPDHVDGELEREWDKMCKEYQSLPANSRESTLPMPSYTEVQKKYKESIDERTESGWEEIHAINYCLLSSIYARGPMARALAVPDLRYAHSAYALMDALHSRRAATEAEGKRLWAHTSQREADVGEDHPERFYRNLGGRGGLEADDAQWSKLEEPDATGFIGLTSHAVIRPTRILLQFDDAGWKSQVSTSMYEVQAGCDVVAFDNLPQDNHGFHHGISVSEVCTSVAFPPYTLVRLKKIINAGEWSAPVASYAKWKNIGSGRPMRGRELSCPALREKLQRGQHSFTEEEFKMLGLSVQRGGLSLPVHHHDFILVDSAYWTPDVTEIRPNCRLLLVTATYKFPEIPEIGAKMCDDVVSLAYGSRQTYIAGLNDILNKPILTMQLEWQRPFKWKDRMGVAYTAKGNYIIYVTTKYTTKYIIYVTTNYILYVTTKGD